MDWLAYYLLWFSLVQSASIRRYLLHVKWVPGNPDGYPTPVIGVYLNGNQFLNNEAVRPFPGPLLTAYVGDTLEITIHNGFHEQITSVHFHGIHQHMNPWMDGVDGITECGISPGKNFTYRFRVDQSGTFWYHAHMAAQYGDGFLGPLVFYSPNGTDHWKDVFQYTLDYPIIIQDRIHETSDQLILHYQGPWGSFQNYIPQYPFPIASLLIDGKGQYDCLLKNCTAELEKGNQCLTMRTPFLGVCNQSSVQPSEYLCDRNQTIRIRIINGASALALRFWIDRHRFWVVARDGIDMEMNETESVVINVGQRIDIIVACNQNASQMYKIFTSIVPHYVPAGCQNFPANLSAFAYLKYSNETSTDQIPLAEPQHPVWDKTFNFGDSMLREFQHKPLQKIIAPPAIKRIEILYNVVWDRNIGSPLEYWQVNTKSFLMPDVPLLQTKVLKEESVWDSSNFSTIIETLEYGQVYEVVIISHDPQQHPWHVHGTNVWLLGAGLIQPELGFDRVVPYSSSISATCLTTSSCTSSIGVDFTCTRSLQVSFLLTSTTCDILRIHFLVNDTEMGSFYPVMAGQNISWQDLGLLPVQGFLDLQVQGDCISNSQLGYLSFSGSLSYKLFDHTDYTDVFKNFKYSDNPIVLLNDSYTNPTIGDSWTVPGYGYVVFRFRADNLGPWLLHCHMEWHLVQGMALVFSIENKNGTYDGIVPPPDDFLVCGKEQEWATAITSQHGTCPTSPPPPAPSISCPTPQGLSANVRAGGIGGLIGLFIGVGIGFFLWYTKKQPNNTEVKSAPVPNHKIELGQGANFNSDQEVIETNQQ